MKNFFVTLLMLMCGFGVTQAVPNILYWTFYYTQDGEEKTMHVPSQYFVDQVQARFETDPTITNLTVHKTEYTQVDLVRETSTEILINEVTAGEYTIIYDLPNGDGTARRFTYVTDRKEEAAQVIDRLASYEGARIVEMPPVADTGSKEDFTSFVLSKK